MLSECEKKKKTMFLQAKTFNWFLHSLIESYKKTAQRGGFDIFSPSMALRPEKKSILKTF